MLFDQLLFHIYSFTNTTLRILLFNLFSHNIKLKILYFVKKGAKSLKFKFQTKFSNQVYKISNLVLQPSLTALYRYLSFSSFLDLGSNMNQ